MRVPRSAREGRGRGPAFIVLGVLLVVDIVLVGLALNVRGAEDDVVGTTPGIATTSEQPSAVPSAPAPVELSQVRTLVMISETNGWRTVRGACASGGASVESTVDGGATWQPVPLPRELTEVQGVLGAAGQGLRLSLASFDAACTLAFDRTFSAGGAWQPDPDFAGGATLVADEETILTAGVPVTSPCVDPRRVVQAAGITTLQCATSMHVERPSADWQSVDLAGVLAISADAGSILVALASQTPECAGTTVERWDASLATREGAQCIDVATDGSAIAIAAADGSLFMWSGDQVIAVPMEI